MPSCQDCSYLQNSSCLAHALALKNFDRPIPPPPLGGCAVAIVNEYCKLIQPGDKILEIGCGTWSPIKDRCNEVGAQYEGIDVQAQYYGKPVVATRIENLATLSYADNTFDYVIGNQTMEHWGEYGCAPEWGLYQCFRVAKIGGKIFLNVPIHFHGTKDFVMGRLDNIQKLFEIFSKQIILTKWGTPCDPIPPYIAHPKFVELANKPAYILDVRAQKSSPPPKHINNRWGFHKPLARLFHYSFAYNVYLLRKRFFNQ